MSRSVDSDEPPFVVVTAVAAAASPSPGDVLAALSLLPGVRVELDHVERHLIESARAAGVAWADIAAALGLRSRQAAEQRLLRISAPLARDPRATRTTRRRQHIIDEPYGQLIPPLRAAVVDAHQRLTADPGWDRRHPRAALARTTLATAGLAAPSALVSLALQAISDLDLIPLESLPPAVAVAAGRLRSAADAAVRSR